MTQTLELVKVPEGTPFRYRGRTGTVQHHGPGSTTVKVQKPIHTMREFTPQTGPRAGITVRFDVEYEVVTWSHSSPVEVERDDRNKE